MLSLGHLSPSTITPSDLQALLISVKEKLPHYVHLPADIISDLWNYYRFLTCSTIIDSDKILVIISIPLLDTGGRFEIDKIHNIPMLAKNQSNMVALYDLAAPAIAVNAERTKYILLVSE